LPAYSSRPYEGNDLPRLITFAQRLVAARLPLHAYYHPGDFVWQLYAFDQSDDARLWTGPPDGALAACAIFEPPLTFQFAIEPSLTHDDALGADVIAWAEERRASVRDQSNVPLAYQGLGDSTLSTWAFDSDPDRMALLERHGYRQGDAGGVRFARDLTDPLPAVDLPRGARFRRMTEADAEARAELHRDAWSVWGESKFSAALYRRLRSAHLYDPDLDVVVEHERRIASYCVCWLDTANGVGYFEPVGTRPSATGHGLGRAVIREGMRRLREKGMRTAFVATAAVNKPAAALYQSAGLSVVDREHFYVKPINTANAAAEPAHHAP
jgi:ribosomal protein S18 acetylase RimI-like enzyme